MALAIPPNIETSVHGVMQLEQLSSSVSNRLLHLSNDIEPVVGRVQINNQSGFETVVNIRDVQAYIIHEDFKWVDDLIINCAIDANRTFNYNLSGLLERPQLLRYTAPSNGYDWHVDIGNGDSSNRKISLTILLQSNFEGGEFCCFSEGENELPLNTLDVIAFSSFLPHKIKPVTKGERWALVAWISGPSFS
jgi:predicted 2-oxoglutarate/Fe(II)-dependent dioxygenase YbiX|tara:strand:- start:1283 stop:1858 length:576 start_codon:yes stop_codon:yes gene_type:complete